MAGRSAPAPKRPPSSSPPAAWAAKLFSMAETSSFIAAMAARGGGDAVIFFLSFFLFFFLSCDIRRTRDSESFAWRGFMRREAGGLGFVSWSGPLYGPIAHLTEEQACFESDRPMFALLLDYSDSFRFRRVTERLKQVKLGGCFLNAREFSESWKF